MTFIKYIVEVLALNVLFYLKKTSNTWQKRKIEKKTSNKKFAENNSNLNNSFS